MMIMMIINTCLQLSSTCQAHVLALVSALHGITLILQVITLRHREVMQLANDDTRKSEKTEIQTPISQTLENKLLFLLFNYSHSRKKKIQKVIWNTLVFFFPYVCLKLNGPPSIQISEGLTTSQNANGPCSSKSNRPRRAYLMSYRPAKLELRNSIWAPISHRNIHFSCAILSIPSQPKMNIGLSSHQ